MCLIGGITRGQTGAYTVALFIGAFYSSCCSSCPFLEGSITHCQSLAFFHCCFKNFVIWVFQNCYLPQFCILDSCSFYFQIFGGGVIGVMCFECPVIIIVCCVTRMVALPIVATALKYQLRTCATQNVGLMCIEVFGHRSSIFPCPLISYPGTIQRLVICALSRAQVYLVFLFVW